LFVVVLVVEFVFGNVATIVALKLFSAGVTVSWPPDVTTTWGPLFGFGFELVTNRTTRAASATAPKSVNITFFI
jgi:hypothetical protein